MFDQHNLNTLNKPKMWILRKIRVMLKRWFSNLEYSKFILDFLWKSLWFWLANQWKSKSTINHLKLIKLEKFKNGWNLRNSRKYLNFLTGAILEKKSSWEFKV